MASYTLTDNVENLVLGQPAPGHPVPAVVALKAYGNALDNTLTATATATCWTARAAPTS
ncbi:MAG: hypothetical protein WDN06_04970 [Asticcacaulis sp.]